MSIPKEFRSLATLEAWTGKLEELLQEGVAASEADRDGEAGSADRVLAIAGRLTQFQVWSDPAIDGTDALDEIAEGARRDLLDKAAAVRVNAIVSRSADLEALEKKLGRRAEEDRAAAAALRGERLLGALDAVNGSIASGMALAESLRGTDDVKLAKDLAAALETLIELRNRIEEAASGS